MVRSESGPLRAKDIFLDVSELPLAEREAALAERCGGDAELRARVERLLGAHHEAEGLLRETGSWIRIGTPAVDEELVRGARIGGYRLVEEIGHGGFGSVWRARQDEPIPREVALKVLKIGMDTREVLARFDLERRALARMDHPNIARVFDGGATERGRPWFAMELVDGIPITRYCEERDLSVRRRLELFVLVCRAVQHAHVKSVVHRDIKPSNVLVSEVDGVGVPKVIDFGIAKAVEDDGEDVQSGLTRRGQIFGTPVYMSPEQIDEAHDVDVRADVYSLGVLLYELLSGRTPFEDGSRRSLVEVARAIREDDPPRPSSRLGRETTVHSRDVRGDLDWIVMRCLEKKRERRYESVDVLANDVRRHLEGDPVLAGPPDLGYRTRKFVRRHRAGLSALAAILLLLVAGIVVSSTQALRARRAEKVSALEAARARDAERTSAEEATRARLELSRSQQLAMMLEHVLMSIDPAVAQGRDPELLLLVLERGAAEIERRSVSPEVEASVRRILGGAYQSLARYDEAEAELARALELREAAFGPDALETLLSVEEYGGAIARSERFQEALALFERAHRGFLEHDGAEGEATLRCAGHLATCLSRLGRSEEALEIWTGIEDTYRRTQGDEAEDTILAMNNRAGVLQTHGRELEALELYERALEIQERTLGELHPRTQAAMNNLGNVLAGLGRADEALGHLERALELKRRVLPPGDPSLLVTLNNIAGLQRMLGRPDEADRIYVEAIERAREHLGDFHPKTIALLSSRGQLLLSLDRLEEATASLEGAVEGCDRVGDVEPELATVVRSSLAEALLRLGRAEEAEPHARAAADEAFERLGPGHEGAGIFAVRHGLILLELGRDGEALERLKRGHERLENTGAQAWRWRAREAIARTLEAQGQPEEAASWR